MEGKKERDWVLAAYTMESYVLCKDRWDIYNKIIGTLGFHHVG